ncbi:MAG: hypothetical protein E5V66_22060 [Mesorhizobium sp.]|nr:hypothetical protein EJ073_23210 [Mesorhizobium sp. M4B.F.Ca.ET.058.02.1.1]RWD38308.1 MAG: hypothetical protein EOS33_00270 [Mesorhizobium sp.]TIU24461.1 MAG: hypothetical protein E5W49_00250 [Mesorhizobium sp.]TIW09581.1 MAG: hypothetical protein E5V66_22060 [Mesorhizobium sp.]TIW34981.1 MAG: hypothetical protein E5V62_13485 [Mesorhizobium sp.]
MDRAARITGTSSQEIGVFAPSAHKTCNWLLTGANSPFYGRAGVAEVHRCVKACATAHYWGREIAELGREVHRAAPSGGVKPFTKHQKNDTADAAAIV